MISYSATFQMANVGHCGKPDHEGAAAGARGLRVRVAAGRTLNLPVNFKLNELDRIPAIMQ